MCVTGGFHIQMAFDVLCEGSECSVGARPIQIDCGLWQATPSMTLRGLTQHALLCNMKIAVPEMVISPMVPIEVKACLTVAPGS